MYSLAPPGGLPTDVPRLTIPTFQSMLDWFGAQLEQHGYLGMILLDASPLLRIEKVHGSVVYDELLIEIGQALARLRGPTIRDEDRVTVSGQYGEQFMVLLAPTRAGAAMEEQNLEMIADRVQVALMSKLFDLAFRYLREVPRLNVGYASALRNPLVRTQRLLYRMVDEARRMARHQEFRFSTQNRERLRLMIQQSAVRTHFQPIVDLVDLELVGYEALSRGPAKSDLESPLMLFSVAEETDLLVELDQLCRTRSILNARGLGRDLKLFVNTLPSSLHDPGFRGDPLAELLAQSGLVPENIVIEVTERLAITGFEHFRDSVNELRQAGIEIAIDDAGTGYSSLETIAQMDPDYIKLDMSLVRGIHTSPLKREIARALKSIAEAARARVIGEGIETVEELQVLRDLGIDLAQGYYVGRPGPAFPTLEPAFTALVESSTARKPLTVAR